MMQCHFKMLFKISLDLPKIALYYKKAKLPSLSDELKNYFLNAFHNNFIKSSQTYKIKHQIYRYFL